MYCGKCGASIPDGFEYCMNCGTKIDAIQTGADNKSKMTEAKQRALNKRVLIPVVGVIILLAVVAVVLFAGKGTLPKSGYFANIPWGTNYESVQKKVEKAYKCETSINEDDKTVLAMIENYEGMKGVTSLALLYCEDHETLNKVSMVVSPEDGSSYTADKICKELVPKYEKAYGKGDNSKGYSYLWNTSNSKIEMVALSDSLIMITYDKLTK